MARFVAKHLVFLLLTLFVVSFLVFALNEFSPGAVARKELGAYATQEQVDLLTKQMGLDRPVLVRYVDYLAALASGDLGYSARFKLPVKDVIFKHLANTALLAAIAFAADHLEGVHRLSSSCTAFRLRPARRRGPLRRRRPRS